jgi:hypothetical protein
MSGIDESLEGPRDLTDGGVKEDEPHAVVFRMFRAVAQHEDDLVADVNCENGKHGPYFGLERS